MRITIFTPTYNRGYILNQLYRSIQRQTYRDFEWLIIDDGSTDDTESIVRGWIQEDNDFPIRYFKQENGGKCRAINRALDLAEGELFFTVDSDDLLTDDALEKIDGWVASLPDNVPFCGVAANCGRAKGDTDNPLIAAEYYDGCFFDWYKTLTGEKAIAYFTAINKEYKYPEFEDETFMTEAVTANRIAHDGYKMRFYNDVIRIYEYLDDGLTRSGNQLFLNNPHGYGLWLKEKAEFLGWSRKKIRKMYYTFTCDLGPYYNNKTIAECIGAPVPVIAICRGVHKLRSILGRKKTHP